jgi:molybdopterin converting factor small subunit
MQFTIKLFGTEAMAVGHRQVELSLGDPVVSCEELRMVLVKEVPVLAGTIDSCRFAVNSQFVGNDHKVGEGDEIALIGMVSGG